MDPPEGPFPCGLHHQTHRLVEALVLLLHLLQKGDAAYEGVVLHGEVQFPLSGLRLPLSPALCLHLMAPDHVGRRLGLLLRILQRTTAGLGLPSLLLSLAFGLLQLLPEGFPPLGHLLSRGGEGGEGRPSVRRRGHGQGLPAPEALRLPCRRPGAVRRGPGLLQ